MFLCNLKGATAGENACLQLKPHKMSEELSAFDDFQLS